MVVVIIIIIIINNNNNNNTNNDDDDDDDGDAAADGDKGDDIYDEDNENDDKAIGDGYDVDDYKANNNYQDGHYNSNRPDRDNTINCNGAFFFTRYVTTTWYSQHDLTAVVSVSDRTTLPLPLFDGMVMPRVLNQIIGML